MLLTTANGTITAFVEGKSGKSVKFSAEIDGKVVFNATTDVDADGVAKAEFRVQDPKLWYPHGYGAQPLYNVSAAVSTGDAGLHTVKQKVGFRKAELVQQPDDVGKTFFFRINDIDVFCGGSDWIPADSFTPRITSERYRKWLNMMVDGYQVKAERCSV